MTPAGPPGSDALPDAVTPVRLPDAARVFEARAARCRALAPAHPATRPYLDWLAATCDAQALACRRMPVAIDGHELSAPVPLPARTWPRTRAWRDALERITSQLSRVPAPAETTASLSRVAGMSVEEIERTADAVLGASAPADAALSVFVTAALQVYWTTLAALVPVDATNDASGGRCPVCGSLPVAGQVLGDRPLRYLTCSLCATAWHLTRLTCAHCGSTGDLSYYAVEGAAPGVKAEACGRCGRYLKLFYAEQSPGADPLVDDVATVALDVLVAGEGFARAGANAFLTMTPLA